MHDRASYERPLAEIEDAFAEFAARAAELAGDYRLTQQGLDNQLDPERAMLNSIVRDQRARLADLMEADHTEAADLLTQPDPEPSTGEALNRLYTQNIVLRRLGHWSGTRTGEAAAFRRSLQQAVDDDDATLARVLVDLGTDFIDTSQPTAAVRTHQLFQQARRLAAPPVKREAIDHLRWLEETVEPALQRVREHAGRRVRMIQTHEGDDQLAGAFTLGAGDEQLVGEGGGIVGGGGSPRELSDRQRARAG